MTSATIRSPARRETIDGLRGVAVMGILLMNIAAFAMPLTAYGNPLGWGAPDQLDLSVWAAGVVLVDGKMRALFSILFGASLLLVGDRAEQAGADPTRRHLARMGWLLVIGLVHAFLIWAGDILVLYALAGTVAWCFRRLSAERLLALGIVLTLASAAGALLGGMSGIGYYASPLASAAEAKAYLGGWPNAFAWRQETGSALLVAQLTGSGIETLGLMLLGMAGLRSGFLSGEWDDGDYRRIFVIGCGGGLAASAALTGWAIASGYDPRVLFIAAKGFGAMAHPVLAAGYAAGLMLWWRWPAGGGRRAIAAAGRMALTNYLATSLVCTTLFYGYGFGLFGRVDRTGQLGIALAIMPLMPFASTWWLARFRLGPAEWLWRSLVAGRLRPMRLAS